MPGSQVGVAFLAQAMRLAPLHLEMPGGGSSRHVGERGS